MKLNLEDMDNEERAIVENGILLIYRAGAKDGYRSGWAEASKSERSPLLTRLMWAGAGMVVAFIASGIGHG